jgi:hypothetical protein
MAFGGAIFSNDPNIGIRMMGKEAFIPTPLNSLTFKGNAQVNARRKRAYVNAPSKMKEKTFSPRPDWARRRSEEARKNSTDLPTMRAGDPISRMFPGNPGLAALFGSKTAPSTIASSYGMNPMDVAKPNIDLKTMADGTGTVQTTPTGGLTWTRFTDSSGRTRSF